MNRDNFKKLSENNTYTLSLMREDDKYFYVEIRALKPGVNRNDWDFTESGIVENGKTFVGQPLLIAYKGDKIGDGHNYDVMLNPKTGELEADFRDGEAERIVGEITNYRIEEQVGEKWLILSAMIWKYYAQQLVDYIIDNKTMAVSVEVMVDDNYETREENGRHIEIFEKWNGLGVTILGQGVTPAVEGARLRALAASSEYKEMKVLAASYDPKLNDSRTFKGGKVKMKEVSRQILSNAMKDQGIVGGFSADGKYASVLRTNGVPSVYPLEDFNENDGIINSKFINASVILSCKIEKEDGTTEAILCEAEDILKQCMDSANAEAETAKAELATVTKEAEQAKAECETLKNRIAELEKAEKDRLLKEMMSAFDDAVNAHNLSVEACEAISEEEINVMHNSINEGKYTDVDAVVGEFKKMAYDKHAAATKKETKTLAWNSLDSNKNTPQGEEAIIAKFANAASN